MHPGIKEKHRQVFVFQGEIKNSYGIKAQA